MGGGGAGERGALGTRPAALPEPVLWHQGCSGQRAWGTGEGLRQVQAGAGLGLQTCPEHVSLSGGASLPDRDLPPPGAVCRCTHPFEEVAGSPVSVSASLTLTLTPAGPWGGHLGDLPGRAPWEARPTEGLLLGHLPPGSCGT